jgi:dolichol-phosphate mannosyltransferase
MRYERVKRLERSGNCEIVQLIPAQVAVIIPSYKVTTSIVELIARIPHCITNIYVVDDSCPDRSGELVRRVVTDPRVRVIFHSENQGVGGAVKTGYREALADGCLIAVKLDGDGQMDPLLIPQFIAPLLAGEADYVKGNRFFSLEGLREMPPMRLFGNAVLSFVNKAVSGYWNLMDPTNGYTAIHRIALENLPLEKIDNRYFFESDLLFRLNTIRAVVTDVPMTAVYGDEESNLRISRVAVEFPRKYLARFFKRLFYNYLLRDFNVCSLEIIFGSALLVWGILFGGYHWIRSNFFLIAAPAGTVILAALFILLGSQLLLAAAAFDTLMIPKNPLSRRIRAS